MKSGDICEVTPRYNGSCTYAHDNGTGDIVRLIRPCSDGPSNWYVGPVGCDDSDWTYIYNVNRLKLVTQ